MPPRKPRASTPNCMGVSENSGTLFGVLIKGSYYLGYYIRVPCFRKPPHGDDLSAMKSQPLSLCRRPGSSYKGLCMVACLPRAKDNIGKCAFTAIQVQKPERVNLRACYTQSLFSPPSDVGQQRLRSHQHNAFAINSSHRYINFIKLAKHLQTTVYVCRVPLPGGSKLRPIIRVWLLDSQVSGLSAKEV